MLTPLTRKPRSTPFLVLDIESKDGPSRVKAGFTRPFLVGVYDGETYQEFRDENPHQGCWDERYYSLGGCIDQAMRYILSRGYRNHHIYAHNAGRFDYLFLVPWLMYQGQRFNFNIIPVSSSIQVLDVTRGHSKWRFLDSYKLIPAALDKALKAFGLAGKLDIDLNLHEDDPEWSPYLKQDCVGLWQLLERFHDYIVNSLGGEVGITAPATSMLLFRRKYLKRSVEREVETHDFVRSGYFGGRVEVFRTEGESLRYFDINSSYPRAMLEKMPAGVATHWDGPPPAVVTRNRIGFVDCDVWVPPTVEVPPLPVKAGEELPQCRGKLVFPVGRLRGVWEWGELQEAVKLGAEIETFRHSEWFEGQFLFRDFVNDIYKYRDKSREGFDEALAQIAKILLNSLYGKFGMKTERTKIYRWDDPDLPDNAVPASPDPDCPIWYAKTTVDAPYIMPQISARVTALARVRLLHAMLEARRRGGHIYYCDTDSVITDVELPTSPYLGDLKDEFPYFCPHCPKDKRIQDVPECPKHGANIIVSGNIKGRFIGPKVYALQAEGFEKVKAKGFEKRTIEMLEKLATGETIYQERLEKIGTLARAGFMRGPKIRIVPRRLRGDAGKRELLHDGSTKPWEVRMW